MINTSIYTFRSTWKMNHFIFIYGCSQMNNRFFLNVSIYLGLNTYVVLNSFYPEEICRTQPTEERRIEVKSNTIFRFTHQITQMVYKRNYYSMLLINWTSKQTWALFPQFCFEIRNFPRKAQSHLIGFDSEILNLFWIKYQRKINTCNTCVGTELCNCALCRHLWPLTDKSGSCIHYSLPQSFQRFDRTFNFAHGW